MGTTRRAKWVGTELSSGASIAPLAQTLTELCSLPSTNPRRMIWQSTMLADTGSAPGALAAPSLDVSPFSNVFLYVFLPWVLLNLSFNFPFVPFAILPRKAIPSS